MNVPISLGVVETNSVDYIRVLFNALKTGRVVTPLRSEDDQERRRLANVGEVVIPQDDSGWFAEPLSLTRQLLATQSLAKHSDIAHISFTSGTEGLPKGVFLSQEALVDVVERVQALMQMTHEAREYIGVPVYHSFGYGRTRHVASVGGQFYIPAKGFDPHEVSAMLAGGEINALALVPSLLRVFLQNPGLLGEERFYLRWLEIGSQAMSGEEKQSVRTLFPNARIVQHYGLTEASRTTLLQIDGADNAILASVGRAYGDCQIKINEQGRICVKGPHVALAIMKDGELSPAVDDEKAWFETSDLGHMVDDYLYFEGRADNVVNCGGQKLSAERLESAILAHYAGGSSLIVVSRVPHDTYGEGFLISYTLGGDSEVIKACALRALNELGIKAKNVVTLNALASIPKTHTGKVQHAVLVREYEARQVNTQQSNIQQFNIQEGTDSEMLPEAVSIEHTLARILGVSVDQLDTSLSMSDIGIDSIQSVKISLQLDAMLGYLPTDWRQLTLNQLLALPPKLNDKGLITEKASVEQVVPKRHKAKPLWDGSSNMNPNDISFWGLIKEDYVTHDRDWLSQGLFALFVNRFGNWRMSIKHKLLRAPMTLLYLFLTKVVQIFCGIKLDYTVHVGRRVKLEHFGGMILGARCIGDDTIIRQNTTFGIRDMTDLAAKPTIQSGVNIGAGAVIVGDITIGRNSVIGPNCVITESLPPFSVVSVGSCVITRADQLT